MSKVNVIALGAMISQGHGKRKRRYVHSIIRYIINQMKHWCEEMVPLVEIITDALFVPFSWGELDSEI